MDLLLEKVVVEGTKEGAKQKRLAARNVFFSNFIGTTIFGVRLGNNMS